MDVQEKKTYVAYYRVSTQQQGASGLGLEAQQRDVMNFTKGSVIASFTDIESGKRSSNRPQLLAAIDYCKQHNATLIVAKLDRLSRNVIFIHTLLESKVKFTCCDMPQANDMTIGIMAVIAQGERNMISERTKKALQSLKERGVKLGGSSAEHCKSMRECRSPKQYDNNVLFIIDQLRQQNKSFEYIAAELTRLNHVTDRKKPYSAVQVFRIYNKAVRGTLSKKQE